jgi:hypothetical protein
MVATVTPWQSQCYVTWMIMVVYPRTMTARGKGAGGQKGNWLPPFVHFAPMESDLVAKVGIRERWFGCVGSAHSQLPPVSTVTVTGKLECRLRDTMISVSTLENLQAICLGEIFTKQ